MYKYFNNNVYSSKNNLVLANSKWKYNIIKLINILFIVIILLYLLKKFNDKKIFQVKESHHHDTISKKLYDSLYELSILSDIAYCVPDPGIKKPFKCTKACENFSEGFELVKTFSSSMLRTSCTGYIAVDHGNVTNNPRIIMSFRGTNSLNDLFSDLNIIQDSYSPFFETARNKSCNNCYVHHGFYSSFRETYGLIHLDLQKLIKKYYSYRIVVVGHSLGGALALLYGAHLYAQDVKNNLSVVTFGQPKVGNPNFSQWLDSVFLHYPSLYDDNFYNNDNVNLFYSDRPNMLSITHKSDPIPQIPHGVMWKHCAGEIFITTKGTNSKPENIIICNGQEDKACEAGDQVYNPNLMIIRHMEYLSMIGTCPYR